MKTNFDIIVVGGGHAGCEAALAAARMGHPTLLVTSNLANIAHMSCNPAIGGLGKGHLVREIDALGGEMGKVADATGIQFKKLNESKGPAVRGTRCQSDSDLYKKKVQEVISGQEGLTVRLGMAEDVIVKDGRVLGVRLEGGDEITSRAVIITAGTFLNGLIHIGLESRAGGRFGDDASMRLSAGLSKHGIVSGRLKTGTCPRLDGRTINLSNLKKHVGDDPPPRFSFSEIQNNLPQVPCYLTYTNARTHEIIRGGLDRSPLFTGVIKGTGPRYCPSIEDKIFKFPERSRHHVFLEPEGLTTNRWYPNGISTSLPLDIQKKIVHSIEGLEDAEIVQPGYGIEYDFFPPTQVSPTLETKRVKGLYLAGQILGTTGYEEAAALGLMAGINASLAVKGAPPLILERSEGYIGVMIDDLTTKGVEVDGRSEPYRMFTSRAEYRLTLREDNASLRLTEIGFKVGLAGSDAYQKVLDKRERIDRAINRIKSKQSLDNLGPLDKEAIEQALIDIHYEGYIRRQEEEIKRQDRWEKMVIPAGFSYDGIPGLSRELVEKLSTVQPRSLGQALRVAGMTPAALSVLSIHLRQR